MGTKPSEFKEKYISTVKNSSLLSVPEKSALLDTVDDVPEDYLENMVLILENYEQGKEERKTEYLSKVQEAFSRYRKRVLAIKGMSEKRKEALISNMSVLENAILSNS